VKLFELFESDDFEKDDPLRVATAAVLSQIKADIDDNSFKGKFTVNALLNKLLDNGINISKSSLIELVSEEPWRNLLTGVEGDNVVFKDEDEDELEDADMFDEVPDDSGGTVEKMAKRAANKPGL
jgi:hypothetical protein